MTSAQPAAATSAPRVRAPHLYEVDVVRILTFACVIAVHTTSHTAAADDVGLYALLGLVHFTREVFFALSGFVLVYSYLSKPVPMKKFWPRRFLLVGVPYVVWSAIYFVSANIYSPYGTIPEMVGRFALKLVTGNAWYHLYFLLVTMQVYLLVPVIVWLIRKTRGHHVALLVTAGVFQLALTAVYAYVPDLPEWLGGYAKVYFFSYLFFILLGAVAADHAQQLLAWVRGHRALIGWVTLATGLVTLGVFAFQHLALGFSLYRSGTPLQPILMVWSVAVGLGFLAVGSWWADRRRPTSFVARGVDVASDRSFGIFLSHPLVLWILLWVGGDWVPNHVATPWLTLVAYVVVLVGAAAITELARRSPVSLPLTGRPWIYRRTKPRPAAVASPGAGGPPPD
ncbi:acyltransferase [Lacisediminihabitans changchengi]|uniref:Acyltransferase n=1 Tax=Lacisediminihabitans changchengi TaxID=2787634 RepID=A0A934W1G1_9MICO|nr:acyltransferase [Lacisediminihabitans changchengi]MBK4346833.1 acyltransferase [Lacisediminihabitans changchengi]MBK4348044.1 acyltransferase [Lacisediminihabitans changchengi]